LLRKTLEIKLHDAWKYRMEFLGKSQSPNWQWLDEKMANPALKQDCAKARSTLAPR
jgi:hypothetical protein